MTDSKHVAGERLNISVAYSSWLSNDTVIFLSDVSGYYNPWKLTIGGKAAAIFPEPIQEDFGQPPWVLGWSPYTPVDAQGHSVVFSSFRDGRNVLHLVDTATGAAHLIDSPYVEINQLRTLSTSPPRFIFLGTKIDEGAAIIQGTIDLAHPTPKFHFDVLKSPEASFDYPSEAISKPVPLTLSLPSGEPVYAIYHPPHNPEYAGSSVEGEKPPCVVYSHGGPTSLTTQGLLMTKEYFTSRGWGWCVSFLLGRFLC